MKSIKSAVKSIGSTEDQAPLREQLLALLRGGQAHAPFDEAVKDFPADQRGTVPPGLPYSAWQVLEHLRIAQRDILNFSAPPTGGYHPMQWPADYWPASHLPPSANAWDQAIAEIRTDLKHFEALIENPKSDLYKPFRWGDGQNLLREALLIADHNAYHLGELVVIRRLLGAWHK
jgi:DinB superfamily